MEFLQALISHPMFWVVVAGIVLTLLLGAFSKTRKIVYAAVIWAEQTFIGRGRGDEKRKAVLDLVMKLIPAPFNWIVSRWVIDWLIEVAVRYLEDWLDDGVINESVPSPVKNWLGEIFNAMDINDEAADEPEDGSEDEPAEAGDGEPKG